MALVHKHFVCLLPCVANAGSLAIGNGNRVDGVGVLMVEDKNIIIPTTGGDVEATSLIGVGFQELLMAEEHGSNVMGARLQGWRKIDVHGGCDGRKRASGTNILGLLILMAKGSGNRFREMFANQLGSEARECSEMSTTDGTQQRGRCWTTKCSVMIDRELLVGLIKA